MMPSRHLVASGAKVRGNAVIDGVHVLLLQLLWCRYRHGRWAGGLLHAKQMEFVQ